MNRLAVAAVAVGVTQAAVLGLGALATAKADPLGPLTYPPCVAEDTRHCVFDGKHMEIGDGSEGDGRSFLAKREPGLWRSLPHRAAHILLNGPGSAEPYLACEYEDSNGCVWDAEHMGNGIGDSYVVTTRGDVHYIPHRAAHLLTIR